MMIGCRYCCYCLLYDEHAQMMIKMMMMLAHDEHGNHMSLLLLMLNDVV